MNCYHRGRYSPIVNEFRHSRDDGIAQRTPPRLPHGRNGMTPIIASSYRDTPTVLFNGERGQVANLIRPVLLPRSRIGRCRNQAGRRWRRGEYGFWLRPLRSQSRLEPMIRQDLLNRLPHPTAICSRFDLQSNRGWAILHDFHMGIGDTFYRNQFIVKDCHVITRRHLRHRR